MPVARATTSAISSAPTCVRKSLCTPSLDSFLLSLAFASLRRFSNSGNLPYCNSATLLKSPLRVSSSIWKRMRSISSLTCAPPWAEAFSDFQMSSKSEYSLPTLMISSSSNSMRLIDASSFSLRTASRSILSCIKRRSNLSITSGLESISILILAAASSIKSIALSGKKRSVM